MSDQSPFPELLRRVRAGDQAAAAELVGEYESTIRPRRADKGWSTPGSRGSSTRWTSASRSWEFLLPGLRLGQFDLERPDDLVRLLVTMARNKLADPGPPAVDRAARQGDDSASATPPRSMCPAAIRPPAEWPRAVRPARC